MRFVLVLLSALIPAAGMTQTIKKVQNNTYQALPFSQNWSNTSLLSAADDWSGVPGIMGYRGDNLTSATGVDPQTILTAETTPVVDVNVDQTDPNTYTTGGATEFQNIIPLWACPDRVPPMHPTWYSISIRPERKIFRSLIY